MPKLFAIKQETTVEDYIERFKAMAAPLPQLSDEVLEGVFLNGLKSVIRAEVLAMEPDGLDQIMRKAQLVEDIDLVSKEMEGRS